LFVAEGSTCLACVCNLDAFLSYFSLTLVMKPANFLLNVGNAVCCHAVQSSEIGINRFDFIAQSQ
jgi:hypothetical protein